MNNLLSSTSLRFNTFASLSSREKPQPDEPLTPRHSESECSYPKLMHIIDSVGCGPPENWEKNYGTPLQQTNHSTTPTRDLINTTKWADQQTGVAVMVEACTQSDSHIACTTVMRRTIAPKIVPSTLSQKRK
jgi:hypothetical protein